MLSKRILFLAVIAILLVGCTSKRYASKARKLDEAGFFTDAAGLYFESLMSNPNNIESKMGLQRTGQLVLVEKLAEFKIKYNNGATKDAVYSYLDARNYFDKLNAVGVKLMFPAENSSYYEEVKGKYLNQLYSEAMMALDMEQFNSSATMFDEILKIDKTYKDAGERYITAVNEPVYRSGLQYLEAGMNRKAFGIFSTLLSDNNGGYKDAVTLRAEALEKATITVAVAPFTLQNRKGDEVASKFRTKTIAALNNVKSPFVKIVNDNSINSIQDNYRNTYFSIVDDYIKRNKSRITANCVLVCNVANVEQVKGNQLKTERPGYIKRNVEYRDSMGIKRSKIEYEKVKYMEVKQNNSYRMAIDFSLIDVATGNVVATDYVTSNQKSEINYATYTGETKDLLPGYWKYKDKESAEDKVYTSDDYVNSLHELLGASREIKSVDELTINAIDDLAYRISLLVEKYNPEI